MPLTEFKIKKIKPDIKIRRYFDERGLYLEVSPKGGKWWRFKYRIDGKEKRLALGVYPDVPLAKARGRRDEARKMVADGIDPSAQRKAQKLSKEDGSGLSFETIGREWCGKFSANWSPGHRVRVSRQLEKDLFPWIGRMEMDAIDAPVLLKCLQRLESRGALVSAHRVRGVAGQVFRYAIATGRARRDPSQDLRGALPPSNGANFAALTEPEQVGELLRAIDEFEGSFPVQCALKFSPLVFARPGEIRHAKWEDIDLENAEWRYRVSKTNVDHIVPLSTQSMKILEELYPLTQSSPYVFPSIRTDNRPMSENTINVCIRRLGFTKEQMTAHGFRAMARTILDEVHGFRPDIIEHQLAHAIRDPNGRAYNRTAHLDERRKMMQEWADYLDELKHGGLVGSKSHS